MSRQSAGRQKSKINASTAVGSTAANATAPVAPLLILVTLLVGSALLFLALRLTTPFANDRIAPDGERAQLVPGGLVVSPVKGGPAGLQPGDVVSGIDGRSLESWLAETLRFSRRDTLPSGETISFSVLHAAEKTTVTVTPSTFPLGAVLRLEWGTFLFYTLFLLITAYVFARRPRLSAARVLFLGAAAQFSAGTWSLGLHVTDLARGAEFWIFQLTTIGGFMLAWIAYFHFALAFPRPATLLRKRRLLVLLYGSPYILLGLYLLYSYRQSPTLLAWTSDWGALTGPHAAFFLTGTLLAIVWQYRRSRGAARRQMRWLVLATLVVAGCAAFLYFLPPLVSSRALDSNLMGAVGALFPLAIAVSILRQQLFDIDTLLNRTLVYGSLTALIAALYVAVVGVLGAVLQARENLFVALLATGVAAILFQPLRERLQKEVNRFMYGERDEPFDVLARLGERLENTLSPDMVFPTIVETVSQTLKLPYAAVAISHQGELETVESYGRPVADPVTYPLIYRGEPVGRLLVGRRAPDEPFSAADERILRNIARQAGAAVHAVQLLADLQQSRRELVTAREEERRRLRRDLHDGLGPQLASQTLTIDAIDRLLEHNPERARALLRDLKAQSREAIGDIRRLVYNLRPPALDELGLVGALRESAARPGRHGLQVRVDAPAQLPALPAAVEVAAYRVAREALTNVVRHSGADACTIRLSLLPPGAPTALQLQIADNGHGLGDKVHVGVGFQSMRERVEELGGAFRVEEPAGSGVLVTAHFPLRAPIPEKQQ